MLIQVGIRHGDAWTGNWVRGTPPVLVQYRTRRSIIRPQSERFTRLFEPRAVWGGTIHLK